MLEISSRCREGGRVVVVVEVVFGFSSDDILFDFFFIREDVPFFDCRFNLHGLEAAKMH